MNKSNDRKLKSKKVVPSPSVNVDSNKKEESVKSKPRKNKGRHPK